MGAEFLLAVLLKLPALLQAGIDVTGLIQHATAKGQQFKDENRQPTKAEWDELNARLDAKEKELQNL